MYVYIYIYIVHIKIPHLFLGDRNANPWFSWENAHTSLAGKKIIAPVIDAG